MTRESRLTRVWHWGLLTLYLLFAMFPLFWLVKISFTPTQLLFTEGIRWWPSETTLTHYLDVLGGGRFLTYFRNSIVVSLATSVSVVVLAGLAGYALSRFRFQGKYPVMFGLLITQTFPLVVLIVPLYVLLAPLGLIDSIWGLVFIYAAFNVPFATFLMQSFYDGIPKQLEEAAMIDGCSRLQALVRVILPLTLPGIAATLGFVFTHAWSELLVALMFINSDGQKTFSVGLLTFIQEFNVNWGMMTAAASVALIPVFLFFAYIQRYLVTGLTAGAIKE